MVLIWSLQNWFFLKQTAKVTEGLLNLTLAHVVFFFLSQFHGGSDSFEFFTFF